MNYTEDDEYWNQSAARQSVFEDADDERLAGNLFEKCDLQETSLFGNNIENADFQQSFESTSLDDLPENIVQMLITSSYMKEDNSTKTAPLAEEVRLLRKQLNDPYSGQGVDRVVKAIMFGQPFCLEHFKSYSSKQALLKRAAESGDGDVILTVVMFLVQTLKKQLVQELLLEYPVGIDHYANYLYTRRKMSELAEFLELFGRTKESTMRQLSLAVQNPKNVLQKLKIFKKQNVLEKDDEKVVEEYLKLTEWQIAASSITKNESVVGLSLVDTIKFVCKHGDVVSKLESKDTDATKGKNSAVDCFAKQFSICDRLYLITCVKAYAEMKDWSSVQNMFIVKGWLGKEKLAYSQMLDKIVLDLKSEGAPDDLIEKILSLVDQEEKEEIVSKLKNRK